MKKLYFILNPKAGQGNKIDTLISNIKENAPDSNIYITKKTGDAEKFIKTECEANKKDECLRFISCGGDGTFNEVLNGIIPYSNAEIGIIPIGTGNDFCRNFPLTDDFFNVCAQANGEPLSCDAIKYTYNKKTRFCANMFNIGFDCNVADLASRLKRYPLISGSLSYFLAVLITLVTKKGSNLLVEADGKEIHNGPLLLTSVANGCFCGGGIKSNPLSSVHDGLIDLNIIYDVSRFEFIKKLPFYMKGTHLELSDIKKILMNKKVRKLSITPNLNTLKLCVDGEISDVGKIDFECVKDAFKFVLPTVNSKIKAHT